ncbi:hypothetical protein NEFER03_0223 [Nematocida sp. LUAm3]|nr:hypothetical protein NEFER03_0223 [Nematocida sp. LUAm3]KAI5173676.1 hypothetical protein NEFER02_0192 [Nematocida sp. LUAm2]KAI5176897.1 hypothetical protein NEFER01_0222 [Nematocida sp. LUAm1]
MEDAQMHSRMLQVVVVEILSQVGFEKANKQALTILSDLVMESMQRSLLHLKGAVETLEYPENINILPEDESLEEERKEISALMQKILIENYAGVVGSYKREELISFLTFQNNIIKQIRREEGEGKGSLLEILRVGDSIKMPTETRKLIDFTGEEKEETDDPKEKKYLDQDVQEYLETHNTLAFEPKHVQDSIQSNSFDFLDQNIVKINKKKKEYLNKSCIREYENMLTKKRLTANYCTPCEFSKDIPFIEDVVALSSIRKVLHKNHHVHMDVDIGNGDVDGSNGNINEGNGSTGPSQEVANA